MSKSVFPIFDAVAVTGTNTYRSSVTTCPRGEASLEYGITFESTSTAAGTLSLEVSNLGDQAYAAAVASAGSEAANTTGWVQRDLSPSATIAVTAASTNTITTKRRFRRFRLKYVNASGSGNITARVGMP